MTQSPTELVGTPNGEITAVNVIAKVRDDDVDAHVLRVLEEIAEEYEVELPSPRPTKGTEVLPLLLMLFKAGIATGQSKFQQVSTVHSSFLGTKWIGKELYVLFSTVIDRDAEEYFDESLEYIGRRIDIFWRCCEGYPSLGSGRFREFIRERQFDPDGDRAMFFVANQISAVDVRLLKAKQDRSIYESNAS